MPRGRRFGWVDRALGTHPPRRARPEVAVRALDPPAPASRTITRCMKSNRDQDAIRTLIADTYAAMSSGQPGTARFFAHPDIAIAGSGLGELVYGPDMAAKMAEGVTRLNYRWTPDEITVWVRGAFAWAQILGHVTADRDGAEDVVPYWMTGVFGRDGDAWTWRYCGGSEPQEEPRV